MHYYSTTLATSIPASDWRVKLFRTVFFFIPSANPDFESSYPKVRHWYVEIDESGNAVREIGLDAQGEPIVAGPWGENYGFWTDSPGPFPTESSDQLSAVDFEQKWADFSASRGSA